MSGASSQRSLRLPNLSYSWEEGDDHKSGEWGQDDTLSRPVLSPVVGIDGLYIGSQEVVTQDRIWKEAGVHRVLSLYDGDDSDADLSYSRALGSGGELILEEMAKRNLDYEKVLASTLLQTTSSFGEKRPQTYPVVIQDQDPRDQRLVSNLDRPGALWPILDTYRECPRLLLPLQDVESTDLLAHLPFLTSWIYLSLNASDKQSTNHDNDALKKSGLLVHCWAGVSRSAAVVAAYLLWQFPEIVREYAVHRLLHQAEASRSSLADIARERQRDFEETMTQADWAKTIHDGKRHILPIFNDAFAQVKISQASENVPRPQYTISSGEASTSSCYRVEMHDETNDTYQTIQLECSSPQLSQNGTNFFTSLHSSFTNEDENSNITNLYLSDDDLVHGVLYWIRRTHVIASPNDGFHRDLGLWNQQLRSYRMENNGQNPEISDLQHLVYTAGPSRPLALLPPQASNSLVSESREKLLTKPNFYGPFAPPTTPEQETKLCEYLRTRTATTRQVRCKKCRFVAATEPYILTTQHDSSTGPQANRIKMKNNRQATSSSASACQHIFVEPVAWMRGDVVDGLQEGRLLCPVARCRAQLGRFSWQGFPCNCGQWVTPAFTLQKARVDIVSLSRPLDPDLRSYLATLPAEELSSKYGLRTVP